MHWLQGGSLASFATSNVRENYFPPFAEYLFLHQDSRSPAAIGT